MAARPALSSAWLGNPFQLVYIARVNAPAPRPKLPLAKVVQGAFTLPWAHRLAFAKALAIPTAAIVAIQTGSWLASGHLTQSMTWAVWVASGILWTLFAIICHRLVLLDQRPADVRMVPGWGRRETLFLLWMVVLTLVMLAVVWVGLTLVGIVIGNISPTLFEATFQDIGAVIGAYLFARLCLVLPATAIDAHASLPKVWRQTRGNGWRMVVVVGVLPWAYNYVASFIVGDDPGIAKLVLVTAAATILLAVEISALSLSYRELATIPD